MPAGHYPRKNPRIEYLLEALKIQTDECQEWPFGKFRGGYGAVYFQGKLQKVHRVVMKLINPDFDPALLGLHKCDRPPCFNPRHLFQGTAMDNTKDMRNKGRENKAKGESSGGAKLTAALVREVRRRYTAGEIQKNIAVEMNLKRPNICLIVNRKTWKHLE